MKNVLLLVSLLAFSIVNGQELYPYAEPASNMPARSLSVKSMSMFHGDIHSDRTLQRHMVDVMLGLNKNWMVHAGTNFSNMHQQKFIWEGARLYTKYRFLSNDDVHKHFRMAAFASGAYSRNHLDHNEINIQMGEQTGVQAGLIATQLWNKFAISGTAGWNEVLDKERWEKSNEGRYAVRSINYSLSAGYLLLPFEYKDYNQTNINLYTELIGSRNINFPNEKFYVDLMPSVQAIFNSVAKLNVGYRFQLDSDIYRLTKNSWMVGFEYLFLNALKKKTK
ncbi:MAG TPA: hypothetical protein VGB71_15060 [Flavisolibacter sp.]